MTETMRLPTQAPAPVAMPRRVLKRVVEEAQAVRIEPMAAVSRRTVVARALTLLGVLTILFSLFQWIVSDVAEIRSQRALRGAFGELLEAGTGLGYDSAGRPVGIRSGSPVALIEIPKIGVSKIVVEGTGAEELKDGPGHVTTTVLPGQSGHAIVAGRRTTYGSPFARLGALTGGDAIDVTTPYGRFRYRVRESTVVDAGEAAKIAEARGSLLTLVTADAAFNPNRALAVTATLDGAPSTFADPPRPASPREGAVPVGANGGALPAAAVTGIALAAVLAVAQELYRRWRRWPTHLLTTPPILCLLLLWMQSIASLLPATL